MRFDKVILRSIISTLTSIVILCLFMFLSLSFLYPITLMDLTYNLGLDKASVFYGSKAYKQSGDVYCIAFATEVAIGDNNDEQIVLCGKKFIQDKGFADYCASRTEASGYDQYIYGNICVSQYQLAKKTQAVEDAFAYIGNAFPKNNAVIALLIETIQNNDVQTIKAIKQKMEAMTNLPPQDKADYDNVLTIVTEKTAEN